MPRLQLRARCLQTALFFALWAGWSCLGVAHGQVPTTSEEVLREAKGAIATARFSSAERALAELLARADLTARQRNVALELSAIVHIAARREHLAQEALGELYRRDPNHDRQVTDLGPAVDSAFERAKQSRGPAQPAALKGQFWRDSTGTLSLRVQLLEGESAVDSVHVFVTLGERAFAHLVASSRGGEALLFPIPELAPFAQRAGVYLEAHAPSGAVLGSVGSERSPVTLSVPRAQAAREPCVAPAKPLRREWWVWTTLGFVLSGLAVTTAITVN